MAINSKLTKSVEIPPIVTEDGLIIALAIIAVLGSSLNNVIIAIVIEASLSFLGVGAPPDVHSWGGMLTRAAQEHVRTAPWVAIFPGMAYSWWLWESTCWATPYVTFSTRG